MFVYMCLCVCHCSGWSNIILLIGSRVEMRRKEMELISRCTENEKENNEPPRKKQKADKPKRKLNFSGKKKKKEAEIKKSQKKRNVSYMYVLLSIMYQCL